MKLNPEQSPLVSFFLATFNRKEVVKETLDMLYGQNYKKFEIVVVDNNSNDGTPEMIEKCFPGVKLIKLYRNYGAIIARNIACNNTIGEIVVSIDDDSFPGINSIVRTVEIFKENPKIGLIPFKVIDYKKYTKTQKPVIDNIGVVQNYWSGCGGAYRRDIFEKLGLWDEWGREAPFEFSVSAKSLALGYINKSFTDIYVYHHWSSVGEAAEYRTSNLADYSGCRSTILFQFKYFPINSTLYLDLLHQLWICIIDLYMNNRLTLIKAYFSGLFLAFNIVNHRISLSENLAKQLKISFNFKGR